MSPDLAHLEAAMMKAEAEAAEKFCEFFGNDKPWPDYFPAELTHLIDEYIALCRQYLEAERRLAEPRQLAFAALWEATS